MAGPDKRRWYRYELKNCWAEYQPKSRLSFLHRRAAERYAILDLSPYGAQFFSGRAFEQDEMIELRLRIPVFEEPLPVKAAIRWVVQTSGDRTKSFLAGVKFMEYGDGVKDRLKKLFQDERVRFFRKEQKPSPPKP